MAAKLRRLYDAVLSDHLRRHRQMAFVSGPRQVGKTTTCGRLASPGAFFNWDDEDERRVVLAGSAELARIAGLERLSARQPTIVFDELHKYGRWKRFLKGFFDSYGERARIVVTGSSRLDVYRRGGDSLMGRYFLFRMHPLSVGELVRQSLPSEAVRRPIAPAAIDFRALWEHGGYPEPFLRREQRFSRRWRALRRQQLLREDVRDLTRVQEIDQLSVLEAILVERATAQLVYSNLARDVRVAVDTVRRWVDLLCSLHHGFLVRPWFKNVAKALRKEPRWYPADWSGIDDPGHRAETFVACHLHKAVEGWTDLGLGEFDLRYIRDKEKREVDFLVVRDRKPWFLVEVKSAETRLGTTLGHFQRQVGARHAFQAVIDLDFVAADCFTREDPCVVPATTLLSQLL